MLKKYFNTEKHSILIRYKKWTDVLQSEKITKDTFDKFLATFKFHKKWIDLKQIVLKEVSNK